MRLAQQVDALVSGVGGLALVDRVLRALRDGRRGGEVADSLAEVDAAHGITLAAHPADVALDEVGNAFRGAAGFRGTGALHGAEA